MALKLALDGDMKIDEYEGVLKQLDRWAQEAKAVSVAMVSLQDKIELQRFKNILLETRRQLLLYIFTAKDVSGFKFVTEQEDVLVAIRR